jgi:hypothetical protein
MSSIMEATRRAPALPGFGGGRVASIIEDVPATLRPPVPLAKAVESVPTETALPGGGPYEPKWGWLPSLIPNQRSGQGIDLSRLYVPGEDPHRRVKWS